MTKYTESVMFSMSDVRKVCIEYNWYTAGDNRAYSTMLDKVENEPYSQELLEWVAEDIYRHTPEDHETFEGYGEDVLPLIMFVLDKYCITRHYTRKEN